MRAGRREAQGDGGMTATAEAAANVTADYQIKGRDLRQAFSGFCRAPLNDAAIWSLSQATAALPAHHIGFQVWITEVAGANVHMGHIIRWSKRLAWASACLKPRMGVRRRRMVEGYRSDWGNQAALDAVELALTGACPSAIGRAEEFGVHRDSFRRVRNFVGGALRLQSSQFESELAIAVRANRE